MKTITLILAGFLATSMSFAMTKTDMNSNWTCETNASSSSVDQDKMADKEMKSKFKSAADAFSFASMNCRDCTKIKCKVSK